MVDELFDIEEPAPGAMAAPAADGSAEAARPATGAIVVRVRLEPGPGRAVVAGRQGDALRVRVAPPPGTERAARAAAEALAELLGVGPDEVTEAGVMDAGAGGEARRGRVMRLRVGGVDAEEARRTLERAVAGAASRGPRARDRTDGPRRPGGR